MGLAILTGSLISDRLVGGVLSLYNIAPHGRDLTSAAVATVARKLLGSLVQRSEEASLRSVGGAGSVTIFVFCKARRCACRGGKEGRHVGSVGTVGTAFTPKLGLIEVVGIRRLPGTGTPFLISCSRGQAPQAWIEGLHASTGSKVAGPWSDHQQQAVLYRR